MSLTSEYLAGLQPGQGVNVSLKTMHNFAITGEFKPTVPTASGRKTQYHLSIIKSSEDLIKTLSVSGSASYADVFSASVSAEFTQQSSLNQYKTFVVAKCIVSYPSQTIERPQITQAVVDEAKNLTKDQFTKKYGTEFLAGIIPGSYYFGVIEIESTTESQQQDISVAVSASGWGASADVSFASKLAEVTNHSSTKVFAIRDGYPKGQKNPQTVDDIIQQAVDFGKADWPEIAVATAIYGSPE